MVAIDVITKAYLNHYDVALLVAGDRNFVNIVKAVKEYTGKLVYGVCEKDRSKHTSKELIATFDQCYDINKLLQ